MKKYRVFERTTNMLVGVIELPITERKDKYANFILKEV